MSVESAIYAALIADAPVLALVSTRIYPNLASEDAVMPYLVYQQIGGSRLHSNAGALGSCDGGWQITCYDSTYLGVRALADAVRQALDGHTNATLGHCFLVSETDIPNLSDNDELISFGKALDFDIFGYETA